MPKTVNPRGRPVVRVGLVRVALAAVLALASFTAAAQWKPTKPITIIVPWAAGGSTDQVTRLTAAELEKALGQKVVIVNRPALPARSVPRRARGGKDGYSGPRGGAGARRLSPLGMLDTTSATGICS